MIRTLQTTMDGQEYNEKKFLVHTPSILHVGMVSAGSLWCMQENPINLCLVGYGWASQSQLEAYTQPSLGSL
jgi:hypothetical protein